MRSRIVTSSRTSDRDRRSTVGLTVLEDAGESEHDDHNRDDDQQFRKTHRRAPLARYFGAFGGVAGGVAGAGAGAPEGAGAGAVAGVDVDAGAGVLAGAGFGGGGAEPLTTDPGPRWPMMASASAPSMNSTAKPVVAFVSSVAPARAPNAAWLLPPPNALAMSPPLPCCSRMTSSSRRQTST